MDVIHCQCPLLRMLMFYHFGAAVLPTTGYQVGAPIQNRDVLCPHVTGERSPNAL